MGVALGDQEGLVVGLVVGIRVGVGCNVGLAVSGVGCNVGLAVGRRVGADFCRNVKTNKTSQPVASRTNLVVRLYNHNHTYKAFVACA